MRAPFDTGYDPATDETRRLVKRWLFQGSGEYFRIQDALRELPEIVWLLSRHSAEIAVGDSVAIWISGRAGGIFAFGHVSKIWMSLQARQNPSYWIEKHDQSFVGKPHAVVTIDDVFLDSPILRSELRANPAFETLSILRSPIGTNFRVTEAEWTEIVAIRKRQVASSRKRVKQRA